MLICGCKKQMVKKQRGGYKMSKFVYDYNQFEQAVKTIKNICEETHDCKECLFNNQCELRISLMNICEKRGESQPELYKAFSVLEEICVNTEECSNCPFRDYCETEPTQWVIGEEL